MSIVVIPICTKGDGLNVLRSERQHVQLLKLLLSLKVMVMISGYRHAIYDDALSIWRRIDYQAPTRQGQVIESAWMNYPEPVELHDYRYLGENYRERERIQRKVKRWTTNIMKMSVLERKAIISAISLRTGSSRTGSSGGNMEVA